MIVLPNKNIAYISPKCILPDKSKRQPNAIAIKIGPDKSAL